MAGTAYESVLCVKNEVFVYQIPARQSNRGYRAADWTLDKPDWVGRLKITSKSKELHIRLEDKNSGELFAQCPVESYPSPAVEQVLDSSRYFVIRIKDDSGRSAFIGIGFADRGDSFDLLVALQDHFKWLKRDESLHKEESEAAQQLADTPKLNLGFKEGQTIRINISTKKQGEDESDTGPSKTRSRPQGTGSMGILPPPPGPAGRIAPPPRAPSAVAAAPSFPQVTNTQAGNSKIGNSDLFGGSVSQSTSHNTAPAQTGSSNVDFLLDLGPAPPTGATGTGFQPLQPLPAAPVQNSDPWGDFTSASSYGSSSQSNSTTSGGNWVNFE